MYNDELLIYRGQDYFVSDYIIIHQPSLDEICKYGEKKYYQMINTLTSVGADLKWQLADIGIDYTKIGDFELFYNILIKGYTKEQTSIIFGSLDFTKFEIYDNTQNGEICMAQKVKPDDNSPNAEMIVIDSYTYQVIIDYLRKMHGFKRNDQLPANESTKQILIDDDREAYEMSKNKEYHSQLLNLISAMVNSEGFKYNHDTVWSMKIFAFTDSVRRILKIKNAELLLQSGYSGYGINLKEIDKKQLDWTGELD
jgi:hypothetical protein